MLAAILFCALLTTSCTDEQFDNPSSDQPEQASAVDPGWLWKQAQEMGDFTRESLAEKLSEEYDVNPDEARNDVAEIIAEWQKVGVVED